MSIHTTSDEKERIRRAAREKARKDEVSSLNYARNVGYVEGFAESVAKAMVKNMLPKLEYQTIANSTGLDISVVKKIKKEGRY